MKQTKQHLLDLQQGEADSFSLDQILRGRALINGTNFPVYVDLSRQSKTLSAQEADSGAVLYIIAVLVFYSAGIVVMIVKYLRREKRELEEERILEDFFRSMPARRKEREQNKVNKVAIHAFHALTSFSYDDDDDIVYTTDDEDMKDFPNTIHEHEFEDKFEEMRTRPTIDPKKTCIYNVNSSDMIIQSTNKTDDTRADVRQKESNETHL